MNKIYKIGNKEIDGTRINELIYGNDTLENTVNNFVVKNVLIQLLEALSDKEEECNCCGWDDNRYTHEPGCNLREEPKQEECEHKWQSSTKLTQSCEKCAFVKTKQSTSLKEAVGNLILICDTNTTLGTERCADKIISLLQSHLVKEVEQVEPTQYVKKDSELNQTYTQAKLDIITIINNISK